MTKRAANGWATIDAGATYTQTGVYGTATLTTATGVVSYALDNLDSDTNKLAWDAEVSDNFTVYVKDGADGTASTAVNFAISGTNDNPTVTAGAQSAQLVEVGVGETGTAAASITLTKGDEDTGDAAVYDGLALTANGWATIDAGATYTQTGVYGTATLTTATGVVSYALDNLDSDTNKLAWDAEVSDNFTVYVKDGTDGTASTAVNFAISGTNDNPTVSAAAQVGALLEASVSVTGTASASITLTKGDPDTGGVASYDSAVMTTTGGWTTADAGATYTKTGVYGTATLTAATNVVSYALNDADTDTNALAGGASVSDNFTVYVKDASTGTASTTVNFAITGSNDTPVSADHTVTTAEDTAKVFGISDFPFTDAEDATLTAVKITAIETAGSLEYDTTGSGAWTAVTLNQEISAADITTGRLRFVPGADAYGTGYATFDFKVKDSGGLFDADPTMTINVTAVNDAPTDVIFSGTSIVTSNGGQFGAYHWGGVNATLFTLATTDIDSASFTYTMPTPTVSGYSNTLPTFSISGNQVLISNEILSTYSITSGTPVTGTFVITSNDGASGTKTETVTLYLGPPSTTVNFEDDYVGSAITHDQVIYGFDGTDTLTGGSGNDWIDGGAGNDSLTGGAGNDTITGGAVADNMTGGTGADTFVIGVAGDITGDKINGTSEAGTIDTLRLDAAGTYSLASTVTNIDAIVLNQNAAGFNLTVTNSQASSADANGNTTQGDLAISAGVAMTNAVTISASGLTGVNAINVDGANLGGADNITGGAGVDTINGGAGADIITGGAGADILNGGDGDDGFVYTATADLFSSNALVDSITGGNGTDDAIVIGPIGATFTIAALDSFSTGARISGVESIKAAGSTTSNISITLNNDAYEAGITKVDLSADTSGTGTNTINVSNVTGTGNGYTLTGSAGVDSITGGAGNDIITGGTGNDNLTGGSGSDTFVFGTTQAANGTDSITDFSVAEVDKLDFFGATTATVAATAITTSSGNDITVSPNNVYFIVGGDGTLTTNTGTSGAAGYVTTSSTGSSRIVIGDGDDATVLAATSSSAIDFNVYRVYDSNAAGGSTTAASELLGTVHMTNGTFSSLPGTVNAHIAPAGIAGEAINLGLTNPTDHVGLMNMSITGIPAGWTLSAGTDNGDGTWTVTTSDVSALTITAPVDYAGAVSLKMSQTWTNADGSAGSAFVVDNVEVYTSGSPIFALSADDNLTGSSGDDTFVFARPIGNNVIHSFDTAADKIDLIGFAGVAAYADLSIANDANGNALVTISNGQTITLNGVDAALLSAANFLFDVDPAMVNNGVISITNGAIMPFGGSIDNTGTILISSTGADTELEILFRGVTLTGHGNVVLSDSDGNVIFGGSADTVLLNLDNTITGAGQLGAGQMTLVNGSEGTIIADGSHALVVDTGSNVVTNDGTMESTGSGGLIINGDLSNNGMLWANDGNITVAGNVSGSGSALIEGSAQLEFGATSSENTTFAATGDGTLKLDHAADYSGTVSGFNAGDRLLLSDLLADENSTLVFAEKQDNTGGMLTVSDGTHTANVAMAGQYDAAGFQVTANADGSAVITYLLQQNQPIV